MGGGLEMGSFARAENSNFSCELVTMGTSSMRRFTLIAPAAALALLAAASPAFAQQGTRSGQVDQSVNKRSDEEKRLAQEPPQINVQDVPELKSADDTKIKI